jgi:hypothetical protein
LVFGGLRQRRVSPRRPLAQTEKAVGTQNLRRYRGLLDAYGEPFPRSLPLALEDAAVTTFAPIKPPAEHIHLIGRRAPTSAN